MKRKKRKPQKQTLASMVVNLSNHVAAQGNAIGDVVKQINGLRVSIGFQTNQIELLKNGDHDQTACTNRAIAAQERMTALENQIRDLKARTPQNGMETLHRFAEIGKRIDAAYKAIADLKTQVFNLEETPPHGDTISVETLRAMAPFTMDAD